MEFTISYRHLDASTWQIKDRRYLPDFVLPGTYLTNDGKPKEEDKKLATIVEVKSAWTLLSEYDVNDNKLTAARHQGYGVI